MKRIALAVLVALSLMIAVPAFAMEEQPCPHDGATIQALHDCVVHAIEMGHISRAAGQALLGQLDGAQRQLDSGQTQAAAKTLSGFIRTVNGLPANQVNAEHAGCLVMHAQMIVDALAQ